MQSVFQLLDGKFRAAIKAATGLDADPILTVAQNEKFGDYQSNAAMGLAKASKSNPRAVAQQIVDKLELADIGQSSIAGPGFINVRLSPQWLGQQVSTIANDARLGIDKVASPRRVVVDYSGPNVAKQMHVGHLRSTIIGDAIARVIEFQGHDVIRQNHIGDWGTQFGMLIAFLKASGQSATRIDDLEDFYRQAKKRFDDDAEFQDEARRTVVRLQSGGAEELAAWRHIVEETRRHFQPIYDRLNVRLKMENERGESFYNSMLRKVVDDLKAAGIAVESEGAIVVPSDQFDNPLIIEKTGGGFLYGTTDLAAIRYRVTQLSAQRIIYTTDSRQAQHFAQVFAAANQAGWAQNVSLEHAPFGTMLGEDGRPFKTRTGDTVKLKDLLDEAEERAHKLVSEKNPDFPDTQKRAIARAVGIGAVKYSDLSKDRVSDYVFSWDKMLSMDGNTAPYLQYAHARIRSIFRKAEGFDPSGAAMMLESPFEVSLAKHLLRFAEIIDLVARELKPHHLCAYLYDLATRFSGFYENCPVIQSAEPTRSSRLLLCDLTARTMSLGLDLLGIEHPDQM